MPPKGFLIIIIIFTCVFSQQRTILSGLQVQSVRRLVAVSIAGISPHRHVVIGEGPQVGQSNPVGRGIDRRRVKLVFVRDFVKLDDPIGPLRWRPEQRGGGGSDVLHREVPRGRVGL